MTFNISYNTNVQMQAYDMFRSIIPALFHSEVTQRSTFMFRNASFYISFQHLSQMSKFKDTFHSIFPTCNSLRYDIQRNLFKPSLLGTYFSARNRQVFGLFMLKQQEEFEDTKGAIRIRISKKNRQHNGQTKKYKRTNNDFLHQDFISSSVYTRFRFIQDLV